MKELGIIAAALALTLYGCGGEEKTASSDDDDSDLTTDDDKGESEGGFGEKDGKCFSDNTCKSGLICVAGTCVDATVEGDDDDDDDDDVKCRSDYDCPAYYYCDVDGVCRKGTGVDCFSDEDCSDGEECRGGKCRSVIPRGELGGDCYEDETCNSGLECSNGVCLKAGECEKECPALGARECVTGASYRSCIETSGCLYWSQETACEAGKLCRGQGVCGADMCPEKDIYRCNGRDVERCMDGDGDGFIEWTVEQTCAATCANGMCTGCITDSDCQPPTKYCDIDTKTCMQCYTNSDCGANEYCNSTSHRCHCDFLTCAGACCGKGETCYNAACCLPDCAGKQCGDDKCGGECGKCAENEICDGAQQCKCVPDCSGKVCGGDGCGGSCGSCSANAICQDGGCVCQFLSCGAQCCSSGAQCYGGACCMPDCEGKECGDNKCGGVCGVCPGSLACENGRCSIQCAANEECASGYCKNGYCEERQECVAGGDLSSYVGKNCSGSSCPGYLECVQFEITFPPSSSSACFEPCLADAQGYYTCCAPDHFCGSLSPLNSKQCCVPGKTYSLSQMSGVTCQNTGGIYYCRLDSDCPKAWNRGYCYAPYSGFIGTCVECLEDTHCITYGRGKACIERNCKECRTNADCPASKSTCRTSDYKCVQCLSDGDCPVSYSCFDGICSRS
ncbi:MAG: hypothetical protein Kow0090_10090 [Myxococcota bacterium]